MLSQHDCHLFASFFLFCDICIFLILLVVVAVHMQSYLSNALHLKERQ